MLWQIKLKVVQWHINCELVWTMFGNMPLHDVTMKIIIHNTARLLLCQKSSANEAPGTIWVTWTSLPNEQRVCLLRLIHTALDRARDKYGELDWWVLRYCTGMFTLVQDWEEPDPLSPIASVLCNCPSPGPAPVQWKCAIMREVMGSTPLPTQ